MGHLLCGAFITFFSYLVFISKPILQMRNLKFKEIRAGKTRVKPRPANYDTTLPPPHTCYCCLGRLAIAGLRASQGQHQAPSPPDLRAAHLVCTQMFSVEQGQVICPTCHQSAASMGSFSSSNGFSNSFMSLTVVNFLKVNFNFESLFLKQKQHYRTFRHMPSAMLGSGMQN